MKLSNEMQAILAQAGLKSENVLYLTIARQYLNKIRLGQKKVEFRALSDFYVKKLVNFDSKGNMGAEKPITHLLLQGGYSGDSPRVLIELKDWFWRDLKYSKENGLTPRELEPYIEAEAKAEGFEPYDTYLAFVLGNVILSEGFKG